MELTIGVDFDNTIVCYDDIFYRVAVERGLIPTDTPRFKEDVRNFLRACGREDDWTEMQGYVYGGRMMDVKPFPGVIDFFKSVVTSGIKMYIISHKTKYPYMGYRYDLHQSAYGWLEYNGFFDMDCIALSKERVFFEETKEQKLKKIANMECTHFVDDLPEFLLEPAFPENVQKLLFYPASSDSLKERTDALKVFCSWEEIAGYFGLNGAKTS